MKRSKPHWSELGPPYSARQLREMISLGERVSIKAQEIQKHINGGREPFAV